MHSKSTVFTYGIARFRHGVDAGHGFCLEPLGFLDSVSRILKITT
jgi:hypothetical protein